MTRLNVPAALAIVAMVALCVVADEKPPTEGKAPAKTDRTGWHGETMPEGMRKQAEKPGYLWTGREGVGIEMVYVPPGEFVMGSDDPRAPSEQKPQHKHAIRDGYYIGRYEITLTQFRSFVTAAQYRTEAESGRDWDSQHTPWVRKLGYSWLAPKLPQTGDHPVVCVTWNDAKAFCDWAGLSLPTEAQWEKAARGTDGRRFPFGNTFPKDGAPVANVADITGKRRHRNWYIVDGYDDGFVNTAPVGSFPAGRSPFGVHEMTANVQEWCADLYAPKAYEYCARGRAKPPTVGAARVLRGGGWMDTAWMCRAADRGHHYPSFCSNDLGFRVVKN
ncbi:formylglycine-generating enzyme family protein [Planctomycetota bacterium]